MTDTLPIPISDLLWTMAELTTTMPTIRDIAAACEEYEVGRDAMLDQLESAIGLGLIDPADDCGPETLFCLSTLAVEYLGIEPTFDSRRWRFRKGGSLIGPHDPDGRYRRRRPDTSEDLSVPLHRRVDSRQLTPDEIAIAAESEVKPYDGEEPENAPWISRFYGIGAIWAGEEVITGSCPYCGGAEIGVHAYCLKCHNAGADRFIKKPPRSRRRQMPRGWSKLKGGV